MRKLSPSASSSSPFSLLLSMPLRSVLHQDCLASCGRQPARSCNQIRAGNASWNSQRRSTRAAPHRAITNLEELITLHAVPNKRGHSAPRAEASFKGDTATFSDCCARGERLSRLQRHRELCNSSSVHTGLCGC